MKYDFIPRVYREGDEEDIVELLDLVFDGWPKFDLECTALDHWRWKYLDNPFKRNFVGVVELEGKIIGVSHGFYQKYKFGEMVYNVRNAGDLAVHPDYRRMGVMTVNSEYRKTSPEKNFPEFVISFTENPVIINRNIKRERPRFPGYIRRYSIIRDFNKFKINFANNNHTIKKIGFNILKYINKNTSKQYPNSGNYVFNKIDRFDERIDDLWGSAKDYYDYILERKMDYLNWRFNDISAGKYEVIEAESKNEVYGYIVLRINRYKKENPGGIIVDLFYDPDKIDVVYYLLEEALKFFESHKIAIISGLALKDHPLENIYKAHGFVNLGNHPMAVFFNPLEKLEKWKNWGDVQPCKIFFKNSETDGI